MCVFVSPYVICMWGCPQRSEENVRFQFQEAVRHPAWMLDTNLWTFEEHQVLLVMEASPQLSPFLYDHLEDTSRARCTIGQCAGDITWPSYQLKAPHTCLDQRRWHPFTSQYGKYSALPRIVRSVAEAWLPTRGPLPNTAFSFGANWL